MILEFIKTDACKTLEQHFPSFKCSVSFTEVSFLHEINESPCGGDDVEEFPMSFILRDIDTGSSVVFFREYDDVVFHGFFADSASAYDYACDRFIMELYQTDFADLSGSVTPINLTASQQESAPVPANAPAEGQPEHICLFDGSPCEKECDEWNENGCWCGFTHFPENLPTESGDKS